MLRIVAALCLLCGLTLAETQQFLLKEIGTAPDGRRIVELEPHTPAPPPPPPDPEPEPDPDPDPEPEPEPEPPPIPTPHPELPDPEPGPAVKAGDLMDHYFPVPGDGFAIVVQPGETRVLQGHVRFSTIYVALGGRLEVADGARLSMIPWVPDHEKDPYQYWGGIIVHGSILWHGQERVQNLPCSSGLMAGAVSVVVDGQHDWKVGDEVCITDPSQDLVVKTEIRKLIAVQGDQLTLDAPLETLHPMTVDPKTGEKFVPRVGLLTRSIVVESEDPARSGHYMVMHHGRSVTKGVSFVNWGRTKAANLHVSVPGKQIGENDPGRYGVHFHHCHNPQFLSHCSVVNTDPASINTKWSVTIHNSSFSWVGDNVICGFGGAGIATEDRRENQNTIIRNLICAGYGGTGTGADTKRGFADRPVQQFGVTVDHSGAGGDGIWARGVGNNYIDNIVHDCRGSGLNINGYYSGDLYSRHHELTWQTSPGGPRDGIGYNPNPGRVEGNEFGGVRWGIWLTWSRFNWGPASPAPRAIYKNTRCWHCFENAIYPFHEADNTFEDFVCVNDVAATNRMRGSYFQLFARERRNCALYMGDYENLRSKFLNFRAYGFTLGLLPSAQTHSGVGALEREGPTVITGELSSFIGVAISGTGDVTPAFDPKKWDFSGLTWSNNGEKHLSEPYGSRELGRIREPTEVLFNLWNEYAIRRGTLEELKAIDGGGE